MRKNNVFKHRNGYVWGGVLLLLILVVSLLGCEDAGGGSSGGDPTPVPPGGGGGLEPTTKAQLSQLISQRLSKNKEADLNDIKTGKITDMSSLFTQYPTFNGNISKWDVSKVVNMSSMFEGLTEFRGNISSWDVSKVTNMSSMFKGATKFNADISGWDVSNVKQINSMFEGASAFTHDTKAWKIASSVSKVSKDVFKNSGITEKPRWLTLEVLLEPEVLVAIVGQAVNTSITRWPLTTTGTFTLTPVLAGRDVLPTGMSFDTSTGTITANAGVLNTVTKGSPRQFTITFNGTGDFKKTENENIRTTLSVSVKDYSTNPKSKAELIALLKAIVDTDGNGVIDNASADLNSIDVSAITDMSGVFNDNVLRNFNGNISGWDVSNVINMQEMFKGSRFTGDISGWDVSKVTTMASMFRESRFTGDISGWDVSNVTIMASMFRDAQFTGDISKWKMNNVTNMHWMFAGAKFNGNISGWDVSNVTIMAGMFAYTSVFNQDISSWAVDNVTTMQSMFQNSTAFNQDLEAWGEHITGRTVNTVNIFANSKISDNNIPIWLYKFNFLYQGVNVNTITIFLGQNVVANIIKQVPSSATGQFSIDPNTFTADTGLSFDAKDGTIKGIPTKEVAKKAYTITFTGDGQFLGKSITLPLSVEVKANKYTHIPTSKTELIAAIKNVMDTDGDGNVDNNKADLNVIYTGYITDMSGIFNDSDLRSFNGDISDWDVSKVINMASMFRDSQFNGDISSWDVSKVTTMMEMFKNSQFNSDISSWKVGKVTNMADMFRDMRFNGDISGWDVSKVTTMAGMFASSQFDKDISNWDVSKVTTMENMFNISQFTGDISSWKVGNVTNMAGMFAIGPFNGNISGWDVSEVSNMSYMFYNAEAFNQNIASWAVDRVTTLRNMFNGATVFDQDLDAWGEHMAGRTVHTSGIFKGSNISDVNFPTWLYVFRYQDGNGIVVSKKTLTTADTSISFSIDKRPRAITGTYSIVPDTFEADTGLTFNTADGTISGDSTVALAEKEYTITFTGNRDYDGKQKSTTLTLTVQDVSTYTYTPKTKTRLIENIKTVMAADADGDGNPDGNTADLNVIYTGNIKDMSGLFFNTTLRSFNGDISGWNVSNVTTMNSMFKESKFTGENGDIKDWNVSNVMYMNNMFEKSSYAGDISGWDVSNVIDMDEMFRETSYNGDITLWDVFNVTDMELMFYKNTAFDKNISYWNVGKVTTMQSMFQGATAFNQDISSWKVDNVTTMQSMFQGATAFDKDLDAWGEHIAGRSVNINKIFNTADNSALILSDENIPTWLYDFVLTVGGTEKNTINGTVGKAIEMDGVITVSKKLPTTAVGTYTISPSITDIGLSLDAGTGAISGSPTKAQSTKNYTLLFSGTGDYAGKSYKLPLSITVIAAKYSHAPTNRTELIAAIKDVMDTDDDDVPDNNSADLNSIYTGAITDMNRVFNDNALRSFNGTISDWDVSKVTNMQNMFNTSQFTGDISSWTVSKVTTMQDMFNNSQFNGDISGWTVSKVTNMAGMFGNATAFDQDISSWDVSEVTNMSYMFYGATAFNQDISSWAVDSVTTLRNMFNGATAFNQDLDAWGEHIAGRSVNTSNMFTNAGVSDSNKPIWMYSISQTYKGNTTSLFKLVKDQQNISITLSNTGVSTFNATGDYSVVPNTFTTDTGLQLDSTNGTISGSPTKALSLRAYSIVFTGNGDYDGKQLTKAFTIQINDSSSSYTYYPQTKAELIANIKAVIAADDDGDGNPNGNTANLNVIYTKYITDMSGVFNDNALKTFNGNISQWDVSNVINMQEMFKESQFDGDIASWNVSNVTNMQDMFYKAGSFNQNISGWAVDSVTTMQQMFREATAFDKDLDAWGEHMAGRTVTITNIFSNENNNGYIVSDDKIPSWMYAISQTYQGNVASTFAVAVGQKNVSITASNTGKSTFNATGVYSIEPSTFTADTGLQIDAASGTISGTPNVALSRKTYAIVFTGNSSYVGKRATKAFTIEVQQLDKVYSYYPLNKAKLIEAIKDVMDTDDDDIPDNNNADLNVIYTGYITNMGGPGSIALSGTCTNGGIFSSSDLNSFNGDISGWDVSNVTSMVKMFCGSSFDGDISDWDVSNVTTLQGMFKNSQFNGNISKWNVRNVRNMAAMFRGSQFNKDISKWVTPRLQYVATMFYGAQFNGDLSDWDMTNVQNLQYMFYNSQFNGDVSRWDTSGVIWMDNMFRGSQFNGDISKWNVSKVRDMDNMFNGSQFNGDISNWNVSGIGNMAGMFRGSPFNGDISKWNVSGVNNMNAMFASTQFNGDISKWNVSNVTNMAGMFYNNTAFTGDISDWNVSQVTNMESMFNEDTVFNGDISKWDVSKVTNISYMFKKSQFTGDISKWNVGKVTTMREMFTESQFTGDISKWTVSEVTTMQDMFNTSKFNGDISDWDVSKVTTMAGMFGNSTVFNKDISEWDVSSLTNMSYMFYGASAFNQDIYEWKDHIGAKSINTGDTFTNSGVASNKIPDWAGGSYTGPSSR